jgi:hypothetical protein
MTYIIAVFVWLVFRDPAELVLSNASSEYFSLVARGKTGRSRPVVM